MALANPRLAVDFEGIDGHYTGFTIDGTTITWSTTANRGSAVVDRAVALAGAGVIKLAADGERVIGRLERVEPDGVATVQDGGYTTLPGGSAATLTNGTMFIGALNGGNPGYIRTAAAATLAEVAAGQSNQIIDSATATAVKVRINR